MVELLLPKQKVAGSTPVLRSNNVTVAQSVEHLPEEQSVDGSIPSRYAIISTCSSVGRARD